MGIVICARSYRKLFSRICVGSIGRNGRNNDAAAMLNMFPKFELVPINRYFIMLPDARRPSRIPRCSTLSPGLTRMMSAASPRDVGRAHDRNPHVGGVQRRGVVDAVAQEAHDVPAALQREDDAILLRRGHAREDRGLLGNVTQRRIVETIELVARDDGLVADADLSTDVTRDHIAIAGDDFDLHAVCLELRERVGGIRQDGIREAEKPGQDELGFIGSRVRRPSAESTIRDREHAESVGTESLADRPRRRVGPHRSTAGRGRPTSKAVDDGQHRFRGALGHEQSRPFAVAGCRHHDRQTPALEIEGDFVDFSIPGRRRPHRAAGWPRRTDSGCRSRSGY